MHYLKNDDGDFVKHVRHIGSRWSYTPEEYDYCLYTASKLVADSSGTIEMLDTPSSYTKETVKTLNFYKEQFTSTTKTFMLI